MALKEKILSDLKEAMKSGDTLRRDTLRMLDSAVKNTEIEKRSASRRSESGLGDEEILEVVGRAVKQRQDSIRQFTQGGRADLAEKEKSELEILAVYLPKQLGEDELRAVISEVIAATGATSAADLGKVMGAVMVKVKGKADGNVVREIASGMLG